MSPTVIKLVTVAIAVAAYVGSAFVGDSAVATALANIASLLVGGVLVPRPGDVRIDSVHPDDLRG